MQRFRIDFRFFISLLLVLGFAHYGATEELVDLDGQILDYFLSGVKLRKCSCKAQEVFVNDTCVHGETYVPILLFHDVIDPFYVDTSKFDVLENSGLKCSSGKTRTILEPKDFFVLPTGELFHVPTNTSFSPIEYCVSHVLDNHNNVTLELQMCMKPPEVQVCCHPTSSSSFCNDISLPLWYGYSTIQNSFIKTKQIESMQCAKGQTVSDINLSEYDQNSNGYLTYEEEILRLVILADSKPNSAPRYLSEDEFCVSTKSSRNEKSYKASFCIQDPITEFYKYCQGFTCVRKCCPIGQLYSQEQRQCIPAEESLLWSPVFHRLNDSENVPPPKNLKMTYGYPLCKRFYALNREKEDRYILLTNGSLHVHHLHNSMAAHRYCMDNMLSDDNQTDRLTLVCFPDKVKDKSYCASIKDILFPILLMISCVFLLITLVVYASIPELHAKLHGRSLLSHVAALFVAYLFLAIVQWDTKALSMPLCRGFASIIQISFLGAFFWLNVMCFDIWWTLRSMRPVAESSESSRRRFVCYSIYAWGCSLIIGIVTLSIETIPNTKDTSHLVIPGFGTRNCWFQDNLSMWAYFYSFVSILTAANIVFFICVAVILIQAQRANNSILRTTNKQHKERVWIYLKLFVVMGITWICEVVSWQEGSCEYWLFTDIVNALQGFFIFVIFICKRNIFVKLRNRGTVSTRKLRRMVQGSSSYGSSSQVTQQTSLDSTRKLSSSLHYHLSRLNREKDNVTGENFNRY